jgi:epoxyqueuosine reductase
VTQGLFGPLEERGYRGRVLPIQRLSDLQEELEARHTQGLLDEELYQEHLSVFSFRPPEGLPETRCLIVVAVPQPQMRVTFTWDGKPLPVIVPPTYYPAQQVDRQVENILAGTLRLDGYRVAQAVVPKKLLATRSGLGAYGRNNLCYVDGMGSFHRLVAFYSDLPCPEDRWQEPGTMESCRDCSACLHNCPTGAITSERFLLHAERCITFHNEKPGDVPFPAWIDPSWHNCLVGCLTCQRVCPQNRDFLDRVAEGPEFSQEETALLLRGVTLDQLAAATAEKLARFDMVDLPGFLPRNLGVFL